MFYNKIAHNKHISTQKPNKTAVKKETVNDIFIDNIKH